MPGRELARMRYEIADVLERQDAQYEPQAYRTAARRLDSRSKDIEDLYRRGELDAIEGGGESIAVSADGFRARTAGERRRLRRRTRRWPCQLHYRSHPTVTAFSQDSPVGSCAFENVFENE